MYNLQNVLGNKVKRFALIGGFNLIIIAVLIFIFPLVLAYTLASVIALGGLALIGYSIKLGKQKQKNNNQDYVYQETIYDNN